MAKKMTAAERHTAAHKARRVAKKKKSAPRFEPGVVSNNSTLSGPADLLIVDAAGVMWRIHNGQPTRVQF